MGPERGGETRVLPARDGLAAWVKSQLGQCESPRPWSVGFCGVMQLTKHRWPARKALPPSGHPLSRLLVVTLTRPLLSSQADLFTPRQPGQLHLTSWPCLRCQGRPHSPSPINKTASPPETPRPR